MPVPLRVLLKARFLAEPAEVTERKQNQELIIKV
jgi:hypothetical protein